MKTNNNIKQLVCLDNGGETLDRYTVINKTNGECIGASDNPYSPMGFGQYCGNIADNYYNTTFGYGWRKGLTKSLFKRRVSFAVEQYLIEPPENDKVIDFDQLPKEVQKYAINTLIN